MASKKRKSFPLRIAQDVYDELRRWSDQEMRSVNSQIEYLLREAVRRRKKSATRSDSAAEAADHSTESADQ